MKILLIVKTSEDRNLRMWGKSSDGTLLKIPLSILFGTTLFRFLLLLLSSSSLSLSTSFALFAFGSSSTVFPSSWNTNSKWEFEILLRKGNQFQGKGKRQTWSETERTSDSRKWAKFSSSSSNTTVVVVIFCYYRYRTRLPS